MSLLQAFQDGRTDLVFDVLAEGKPADFKDENGVSLLQTCAYYGDVSAIKFLLSQGAKREALGENLGLDAAAFHGHWRLCQFLLEQGADVNHADGTTGETALHAALCTTDRLNRNLVMKVLLANGADPNRKTKPNQETGGFMRDCRTKGEMALHRAAAFGDEDAIQMLLDAGAFKDAKDMNGDSPLSWGSWYARPTAILRKLLYGNFRIHPNHTGMAANLQGGPNFPKKA